MLVFDIETYFDPVTMKIKPVTVQYALMDKFQQMTPQQQYSHLDKIHNEFQNGNTENTGFFTGENCMNEFLDWFMKV